MKALVACGNQADPGGEGSKYPVKEVKAKTAHWDKVLHGKCHGNCSYSLTLRFINDIK